jgi:3-oxoacyl-[acyl-carrier protein] reductase
METSLNNKRAVIFGASGGVGSGVAKVFAVQGATVFLSGRNLSKVEKVVSEIRKEGGSAEASEVDALDQRAVDSYLDGLANEGQIDFVLNAIGYPPEDYGNARLPLDVSLEQFTLPLRTIVPSQFITATSAARHMIRQHSGVILFVTANPSRGVAAGVSIGAAFGAMESMLRCLAQAWGPQGVRVVGIRAGPMVDTRTMQETYEIAAKKQGITKEQVKSGFEQVSLLKSSSMVDDTAWLAAFLASNAARTITGAIINANSGRVID